MFSGVQWGQSAFGVTAKNPCTSIEFFVQLVKIMITCRLIKFKGLRNNQIVILKMDNLILEVAHQATDQNNLLVRPDQAVVFVQICQPKSFQGAQIGDSAALYLDNKDFWRNLHTILREKAIV